MKLLKVDSGFKQNGMTIIKATKNFLCGFYVFISCESSNITNPK